MLPAKLCPKNSPIEKLALTFLSTRSQTLGFPGSSDGKQFSCSAGDPGSFPGQEVPLEKEMATHSSILAWGISWTEGPGRLQSMGSQSVKYS